MNKRVPYIMGMTVLSMLIISVGVYTWNPAFTQSDTASTQSDTASTQNNVDQVAAQEAAKELGVSASDVKVLDTSKVDLSTLGQSYYVAKALDLKTGRVVGVALSEDGKPVNREQLEEQETQAYFAQNGKFDPALKGKISSLASDSRAALVVWLTSGFESQIEEKFKAGPGNDRTGSGAAAGGGEVQTTPKASGTRAERAAAFAEKYAENQAVVQNFANTAGGKTLFKSKLTPLMVVELPVAKLNDLAALNVVDTIYLSDPNKDAMLDTARLTHGFDRGYQVGLNSGVKVAVHEAGKISTPNPFLGDPVHCSGGEGGNDHPTWVAGTIASRHPTFRGQAPYVTLLSANAGSFSDAGLFNCLEWAVAQDAEIINMSWGAICPGSAITYWDRYVSSVARYHFQTITIAAGNQRSECPTNMLVGWPARGQNIFSVGAISNANTGTWSDDIMASYSRWQNPANGAELPHFVCTGSDVRTTHFLFPWITAGGVSGTSFAAPCVAGEAAVLMHQRPTFETWWESLRAVLMASSVNNIEGATRLSSMDGTGSIWMGGIPAPFTSYVRGAADVVANGWVGEGSIATTDNTYVHTRSFSAVAGEKVRFAITWDANPAHAHYPFTPSTDPTIDYDLHCFNPSGALIAGSFSVPNNYEIAEFTASTTGTYNCKIYTFQPYSGAPSSNFYGEAWWRGSPSVS